MLATLLCCASLVKSRLKGLGLEGAETLTGDEFARVVQWNGSGDLSGLKDKDVSLRLHLHKAKMYSTALGCRRRAALGSSRAVTLPLFQRDGPAPRSRNPLHLQRQPNKKHPLATDLLQSLQRVYHRYPAFE